tara:strand:+ start:810 stop:1427 length:618 start_codon:yes stop_codon:yes gene_type:complete
MTAFESYKMYVALKLHFTTDSYDYFKFNGKTRVSETNFEKRKDRYFFKKLTNRKKDDEILPYFVANFVADSSGWIGNMVRSDGDDNYRAWKKRMESLHYTFSEEVDFLLQQVDQFDHLFKVTETHPPLVKFLLGKQISMETFVILNQILNFIPQFDKKIVETIVWSDVRRTVMKYTPFVSVDTVKYKHTLKEKVLDHKCLSLNQK